MKHFLHAFTQTIVKHPLVNAIIVLLMMMNVVDNGEFYQDDFYGYGFVFKILESLLGYWIITRLLKLYIYDNKKLWFEWCDFKAFLIGMVFIGVCTCVLMVISSVISSQYYDVMPEGSFDQFIYKYAEFLVSVLLYSILVQFGIVYFISIIVGDALSFKEALLKTRSYLPVLIGIALLSAVLQLSAQYSADEAKEVLWGLKQFNTLIYFWTIVAVYKVTIR